MGKEGAVFVRMEQRSLYRGSEDKISALPQLSAGWLSGDLDKGYSDKGSQIFCLIKRPSTCTHVLALVHEQFSRSPSAGFSRRKKGERITKKHESRGFCKKETQIGGLNRRGYQLGGYQPRLLAHRVIFCNSLPHLWFTAGLA